MKNILSQGYLLQIEKGSFSAQELAQRTKSSYGHISRKISELGKGGLIRKVSDKTLLGSGGKSCLRGFAPSRFMLTKKGRKKIKVVLTGGVFDILHSGHLGMLTEAKALGDILVVVIARESFLKKKKPINPEKERLAMVSSLRQVDMAILGSDISYLKTIQRVGPDTIALGYDQDKDEILCRYLIRTNKLKISLIRIPRSKKPHSTTSILARIKAAGT